MVQMDPNAREHHRSSTGIPPYPLEQRLLIAGAGTFATPE